MTLDQAIRDLGREPATWDGELRVHTHGKTGEALFLTGAFPAVRKVAPRCRIVVQTYPHYVPVFRGAVHRPDRVELHAPDAPLLSRRWFFGLRASGDALETNAFSAHPIMGNAETGATPFYRLFSEALGVDAYEAPEWHWPEKTEEMRRRMGGRVALAVPLSVNGRVHAAPGEWAETAASLEGRGIAPFVCTHPHDVHDAWRETPGWAPLETTDVSEVLSSLPLCTHVLGVNSGLVFAALLLSPGRVTMLDDRNGRGHYRFSPAMERDAVVHPSRHAQVPVGSADIVRSAFA